MGMALEVECDKDPYTAEPMPTFHLAPDPFNLLPCLLRTVVAHPLSHPSHPLMNHLPSGGFGCDVGLMRCLNTVPINRLAIYPLPDPTI